MPPVYNNGAERSTGKVSKPRAQQFDAIFDNRRVESKWHNMLALRRV